MPILVTCLALVFGRTVEAKLDQQRNPTEWTKGRRLTSGLHKPQTQWYETQADFQYIDADPTIDPATVPNYAYPFDTPTFGEQFVKSTASSDPTVIDQAFFWGEMFDLKGCRGPEETDTMDLDMQRAELILNNLDSKPSLWPAACSLWPLASPGTGSNPSLRL